MLILKIIDSKNYRISMIKTEHNIIFFQLPCLMFLHPPKIPQFNLDIHKDYKPKAKRGHAPIVNIVQKVKSKEKFKIPFQPRSDS